MKPTNTDTPIDVRPFGYAISLINGKWKMQYPFNVTNSDLVCQSGWKILFSQPVMKHLQF